MASAFPPPGASVGDARPVRASRRRARALVALLGLSLCSSTLGGGISVGDDLFIGVWSPFGKRWEAEASVCIWGEDVFRVIASSVELGNVFALSDSGGARVPYRVFWRRRDAPGRGQELDPGVPSRRSIAGDARFECAGGVNARIRVKVERRDIDRAPPGIYDDTLMLTLSPL